ncbi:hypothetical protein [Kitasatospora sp. SolWspMP-SS2h]|uniref:hypothetical protein n=1 Tax=Kitasatospora sp. SolWspMP-SS2h TaxID=1305729 RepID=UPI0011B94A15|nr:hypothetical protein [Kitasatospora sp. SolWspMP-SS2h]
MVLETGSPDDGVGFLLRSTSADESSYSLELVVRGDAHVLPLVCAVRYTGPDGRAVELFVPVARATVGPSASYVALPGFGPGSVWSASVAVPVEPEADWDPDAVAASIAAARNEATRAAWRQVRERVGGGLRDVIDGALR